MIERTHPKLSVGAQCRLLSISRSSFNYAPQGETEMNLGLMLLVDKQYLDTPFYGARPMTWHLQNEGHDVYEKRIRRQMRPISADCHAIACRAMDAQRLLVSCRHPWAARRLPLIAALDWFTRTLPAWRILNMLEAEVCLAALNQAIHKFGPSEIMNTDHGSQFTSFDCTDRLTRAKTKNAMDGKARYLDTIFTQRLWRSIK